MREKCWREDESGASAAVTAIVLAILIGAVALAVDVGHLAVVRNELQNAADAAALAGARELYNLNPLAKLAPIPAEAPYCAQSLTVATQAAGENRADTQSLAVATGDARTGVWNWDANTFTANASCSLAINAVHVTMRKDEAVNQPVKMWFAWILSRDWVEARARATAAVGFVQKIPPGTLFPIAMNKQYHDRVKDSPGSLNFNPDNADNGGWCSPADINPNANLLKQWIDNGIPEACGPGDHIDLLNGVADSVLKELKNQLQAPGHWDNDLGGWLVLSPVVEVNKFNQSAAVAEFQPIVITEVQDKGNPKYIKIKLFKQPLLVGGAESGGPVSNLYATQPKLVQ